MAATEQGDPVDPIGTWILGGFLGFVALIDGVQLLTTPIGDMIALAIAYLVLFVCSVGSLHCLLVVAPRLSGRGISARAPKYLEYAYTIVISLSLTQILFSSAKILEHFGDDEKALISALRSAADETFAKCRYSVDNKVPRVGVPFAHNYTPEYCDQLDSIRKASDRQLDEEVLPRLAADRKFMEYVTELVIPADPQGRGQPMEVYSGVPAAISRIQNVRKLRQLASLKQTDPFGWLAIVLLPLGLALRLTKTSLELYGKLNAAKA
jgi:hypothetical protein